MPKQSFICLTRQLRAFNRSFWHSWALFCRQFRGPEDSVKVIREVKEKTKNLRLHLISTLMTWLLMCGRVANVV